MAPGECCGQRQSAEAAETGAAGGRGGGRDGRDKPKLGRRVWDLEDEQLAQRSNVLLFYFPALLRFLISTGALVHRGAAEAQRAVPGASPRCPGWPSQCA